METLEQARQSVKDGKIKLKQNGLMAVIVKTEYAPGKHSFGVQFWTEEQIYAKQAANTDGTVAHLVEFATWDGNSLPVHLKFRYGRNDEFSETTTHNDKDLVGQIMAVVENGGEVKILGSENPQLNPYR